MSENNFIDGVAVSTRVRLARNIADVPFPNKMTDSKTAEGIVNMVYSAIGKVGKFNIAKMSSLSETEARALMERHLISSDLIKNKNGAAIINQEQTVSIMVNEEDHIRAQCIQKGFKLKETYDVIDKLDDLITEKLEVAFNGEFGYLTACPTNLGTGMRASVMLFLPCLTISNRISSIINVLAKGGITVRGVYGEGSVAGGHLYQISNQMSLGISEQDILNNVNEAVQKVCRAETSLRTTMFQDKEVVVRDRLLRAYGVLTNCAKLDTIEFMQLIADVKLAAILGIIKVDDENALEELIVKSQQANITLSANRKLTPDERDIYRAEYVGKVLRQIVSK